MEILFWIVLMTWMVKRGAEDVAYAVRGQTSPRHRERMERIKRGESQARYGVRGWRDDAMEDFLRANTHWRRSRAARKAAARLEVPIDDMVDVAQVRESRPAPEQRVYDPNNTRSCTTCKGEVVLDGRPCPTCLAEQERRNAEWEAEQRREAEWKEGMRPIGSDPKSTCVRCRATYAQPGSANCPACDRAEGNYPDDRPTARIYQFPNIQHIEKEIDMSNPEATGLSTAIAFAEAAAQAHASFSTAGSEGYAGALERMGFGEGITALAAAAREQSTIAAAKWEELAEAMGDFQTGREFYASNPDAPDKVALVNE